MDTNQPMQEKTRRFRASEIATLIFQIFFLHPRKSGNWNGKFLQKMNRTWICLMAGAIRHCLSKYLIGDKSLIEFKDETAASE